MHFGKTYAQLLLTLPRELQENAIEYRQLKKLINKIVNELASLGLSPSVLHNLLDADAANFPGAEGKDTKGKGRAPDERPDDLLHCEISETRNPSQSYSPPKTKAIYEIVYDGERIHPRLRLQVTAVTDGGDAVSVFDDDPCSSQSQSSSLSDSSAPSPVDARYGICGEHGSSSDKDGDIMLIAKPIVAQTGQSLIWALQRIAQGANGPKASAQSEPSEERVSDGGEDPTSVSYSSDVANRQTRIAAGGTREVIVPLQSDTAFFQLLHSALQTLSSHLQNVRSSFIRNLETLASTISHTARPRSALSGSFHPMSSTSDPRDVSAPLISPFSTTFIPGGKTKSDLYAWREIFQLYVEAEVFESVHEQDRGERDLAESERRLALFAEQVTSRGLNDKRKLALKQSRDALETFLQLNVLILNLKKFQFANAEAARKILKKHAKRTALPFPIPRLHASTATLELDPQVFSVLRSEQPELSQTNILTLIPAPTTSLAHLLVQAIGETLLPVIPHLDDYSCLICGDIAFKPIRLNCRHLFCVRCLVKMQKRGQDHCPCCRAPTVLTADRSNVDWAMLNFMQDWFPRETAKKLKQNEKEAVQEQMEELGIPDQGCMIA